MRAMKHMWLVAAVVGCGGAVTHKTEPGDPLAVRCRTNIDACMELSERPVDAAARQASCDRGDRDACLELGLAYADGRGVSESAARALQLYERACAIGHPIACGLAALAHQRGQGTAADAGAALRLYTKGCEAGDGVSCDLGGRMREDGEGTAADPKAAARLYARACSLGNGAGCRDQGILLSKAERFDRKRTCSLFEAGCKHADAQACDLVVSECEREVPGAYENRDRYQTEVAVCPSMGSACVDAGKRREGSPGVAASPREAGELYRKGCELGELAGCLGLARLQGARKVAGDPNRTLADACARSVPGACLAAGRSHAAGELGPRDPALAVERLAQACAQADSDGCLELARARRDRESFRAACAAGSLVACREGKAAEPGDRAFFDDQVCFHDERAACSAGVAIAGKTIALDWPATVHGLAFAGSDGRGILASANDQLALLDPAGRVAAGWRSLASASQPGPRAQGPALRRSISSSAWRWDGAAQTLVGVVGVSGYGAAVDHGIALWSPMSEVAPVLILPAAHHTYGAMAISADARFAIARSHDGAPGARVLDLKARKPIGELFGTSSAMTAAFAGDGSRAAVGFRDGKIALVDTGTGRVTFFDASSTNLASLSFHPKQPLLASVDQRDRVRVWQLDALGRGPRFVPDAGYAAAFSPDGRYLAISTVDRLVLRDATTLRRVAKPVPFRGGVGNAPIAFSPDSRHVAVAIGGGVAVFDLEPRAPLAALDAAWFGKLRPLAVPAPPASPPFARDATIAGTVTMDGRPVAGAEIELTPSEGEWNDARALPARTTRSARDGRFAFDRVAAIEWRVTVKSAESQVSQEVLDLRADKTRGQRHDVALVPGVTVRGTVLDPSGKPAAGVRVMVPHLGRGPLTTDRAGAFAVRHLTRDARFRVHARRADGAVGATEVDLSAGTAGALVVRMLAPSDPRVLHIQVVDKDKRPVAGVRIELDGQNEGDTDENGRFSAEIAGDKVNVVVRRWPEILTSQDVALPPRGTVTLTTR
jgi:uncharacterized protein